MIREPTHLLTAVCTCIKGTQFQLHSGTSITTYRLAEGNMHTQTVPHFFLHYQSIQRQETRELMTHKHSNWFVIISNCQFCIKLLFPLPCKNPALFLQYGVSPPHLDWHDSSSLAGSGPAGPAGLPRSVSVPHILQPAHRIHPRLYLLPAHDGDTA